VYSIFHAWLEYLISHCVSRKVKRQVSRCHRRHFVKSFISGKYNLPKIPSTVWNVKLHRFMSLKDKFSELTLVFVFHLLHVRIYHWPHLWSSGQSSWLHNGDVLWFLWGTNPIYICYVEESRPPLWSSGQSSWLHNGDVLWFLWGTNPIYICYVEGSRPPLWSSGQSSWLQIRRPGFDSRHYQKKSSGSGTRSSQPRDYNWGATW
jgi:hypothetical protein